MVNEWEEQNRTEKAVTLVQHLKARALADLLRRIERWSDDEWAEAAEDAGVNPPSRLSQRMVLQLLRGERLRTQPADPFEDITEENRT
jgi:hypothetical protein